jgi:Cu2+-exporting ATPase
MGCCGSGAELTAALPEARSSDEEVLLASRIVADGMRQTDLSVPTMHCGACVRTIESARRLVASRAPGPTFRPNA